MGDLIEEILAKLRLITDLKTVLIWNNQFQYIDDGSSYSFSMPCAFVEVQTPNTQDIAGAYQGSDIEITVHIGQDFYNTATYMEQNVTIFTLRDLVIKSLSHFTPTTGSLFKKISEEQDFEHTNVYHYKITYKTHWIDNAAVLEQLFTTPPTNLTINRT